jgi:uncharacterized membrane protein
VVERVVSDHPGRHGRPASDADVLHHPAVVLHAQQRAKDAQLRLADRITAVAGSMQFVYFHVIFFACWMLVFEENPWPTLTLAVSLEAIFLSTFVLISQNRQGEFQRAKADHDYETVNRMLEENTRLTRSIHQLTRDLRARLLEVEAASGTSDRHDDHGNAGVMDELEG